MLYNEITMVFYFGVSSLILVFSFIKVGLHAVVQNVFCILHERIHAAVCVFGFMSFLLLLSSVYVSYRDVCIYT